MKDTPSRAIIGDGRDRGLGVEPWRLATAIGLFLAAVVGIIFTVIALTNEPPTVDYAAGHQSGQPVNVTMQTVGSFGSGNHPTWVSYLARTPEGQWVHTTLCQVPAHARVNVTIYQYDSGSPLRNQQLGQVTGTYGNVALLNGKPFRVINSNVGNGVAHTFSMPSLGINVPLYANNRNANLCAAAPCTTKSPVQGGQVLLHQSRARAATAGSASCRAALGFLYGNGGPMSTLGYMGGFMKVVA